MPADTNQLLSRLGGVWAAPGGQRYVAVRGAAGIALCRIYAQRIDLHDWLPADAPEGPGWKYLGHADELGAGAAGVASAAGIIEKETE